MNISIDEIHIEADPQEALAIAHDIDALVNELTPDEYMDGGEVWA